jgi:hypothetical protein
VIAAAMSKPGENLGWVCCATTWRTSSVGAPRNCFAYIFGRPELRRT